MIETTPPNTAITEVINVTDKAITRRKEIRQENNIPETYGLRTGIKGSGVPVFRTC